MKDMGEIDVVSHADVAGLGQLGGLVLTEHECNRHSPSPIEGVEMLDMEGG